MSIVNIGDAQFEEEVMEAEELVMVDFWAEWCGPCKALGPKLEEIAQEKSDLKIVKINIDQNKETAQKFGVRSIPTMIFFKGGKDVETLAGNLPKEEIISKIEAHI